MKKRTVAFVLTALLFPGTVSAASLKLSWSDMSTNEDKFQIERSLNGSTLSFSLIAEPGVNSVTYTDSNLPENTEYAYRIRACNVAGCSSYSNVAIGKTPITIPATPGTLTVTPLP